MRAFSRQNKQILDSVPFTEQRPLPDAVGGREGGLRAAPAERHARASARLCAVTGISGAWASERGGRAFAHRPSPQAFQVEGESGRSPRPLVLGLL